MYDSNGLLLSQFIGGYNGDNGEEGGHGGGGIINSNVSLDILQRKRLIHFVLVV